MNKISLMPQVNIYQGIFSDEDLDFLLNEIKKSQIDYQEIEETDPEESALRDFHGPQPEDRNDGSTIKTWTPWYSYGLRSIWSHQNDESKNINQIKGYHIIDNVIKTVHDDYVKDWSQNGQWTYDIKNWEKGTGLSFSTYEILQHKMNPDKKYTIHVHTDWHNHRSDEPGPKQIITYTLYLNDDYEGGEIDFVDENNQHVYVYKPKRGDVTVFPSGQPYWHGARGVTSGNPKIFIRTFSVYTFKGTEEWNQGCLNWGATRWVRMESERVDKWNSEGNVGRQLVYSGEEPNESLRLKPIFVKSESYIDGREIK